MPSQQAMRCVVAYQVGDGPAHGSYVAGAGLRDEVHEPVPLVAVVAAHRRDHGSHPVDRHGIRRGVCQRHENHYRASRVPMCGGGQWIAGTRRQRSSGTGKQEVSGGVQNPFWPFRVSLRFAFEIFISLA